MNDVLFILCCAGLGLIVGVIFIGVAMVKKGMNSTGSACYTRDGYHQEF